MRRLGHERRKFLEDATTRYQEQLHGQGAASPSLSSAWQHLIDRGLGVETYTLRYRLGVVGDPAPGHEMMVGRLAIPYITPTGVVDMKFRCVADHICKESRCPKYLGTEGGGSRLYNARAVLAAKNNRVVICEGEFDAMAISAIAGVPAVGYPGTGTWGQKFTAHWPRVFAGLDAVVVADGDEPGQASAKAVVASLESARIVHMPDGEDASSILVKEGAEAFRERLGIATG